MNGVTIWSPLFPVSEIFFGSLEIIRFQNFLIDFDLLITYLCCFLHLVMQDNLTWTVFVIWIFYQKYFLKKKRRRFIFFGICILRLYIMCVMVYVLHLYYVFNILCLYLSWLIKYATHANRKTSLFACKPVSNGLYLKRSKLN